MTDVTRPHVDSFNWMLKEGLMKAANVCKKLLVLGQTLFLTV